MSVNTNHVRSLLEPLREDDTTAAQMRDAAAEYEEYAKAGRTLKDGRTTENVSPETLAEVARLLRERADALDAGMTVDQIAAEQNREPGVDSGERDYEGEQNARIRAER